MPVLPSEADQLTLPSVARDFVEWHRGRSCYAVWAIDVDGPGLAARGQRLRGHFARQLLPAYHRQPHVTLSLCGFPSPRPVLGDDYGCAALAAQVASLLVVGLPPFVIEIGQVASFTSAAYFSVADPQGGIAAVRRALQPTGDSPGVPHVTFGLYRQALPLARLVREMRWVDGGGVLRLEIDRLSLMTYRAAQIGGPLHRLAGFDLRRRRFAVEDAAGMRELFGEEWQETVFA